MLTTISPRVKTTMPDSEGDLAGPGPWFRFASTAIDWIWRAVEGAFYSWRS
jgi:hypothetical protein